MVKLEYTFPWTRFRPRTIRDGFEAFRSAATETLGHLLVNGELPAGFTEMNVRSGVKRWTFDHPDEFFSELRGHFDSASVTLKVGPGYGTSGHWGHVFLWSDRAEVKVELPSRENVLAVMSIFEEAASESRLPQPPPIATPPPTVFIGHGGKSSQWRDLKDHLHDQHGYEVVAYETGARAGHTIRDVLSDMLDVSSFAVLVMTAEDEQDDGTMRARQNVVHEAGLFQGRLGFPRTVILLEKGTENFSNLDGIQYIGFTDGNIRETYGDVLATLRREFPPTS